MDYTQNKDYTLDTTQPKKSWQDDTKKVLLECPQCKGKIIRYSMDTVYTCMIHKSVPKVTDLF